MVPHLWEIWYVEQEPEFKTVRLLMFPVRFAHAALVPVWLDGSVLLGSRVGCVSPSESIRRLTDTGWQVQSSLATP
jgi:hypothetical protein